jgi:DNA ligase (NAD+)
LTKPDTDYNRAINNPVEFPTKCPVCGEPITISDTGKSAKCININCPDRLVYRMTAFLETLNVSNFGEETIRTLGIKSIRDYLNITDVSSIGPNEGRSFIESRNNLISNPIPDYKIMTAMGYPGIGEEKFKTILREYTISELISSDKDSLANLLNISGIGQKIIDTIYEYNNIYRDDILTVLDTFNIVYSKGLKAKPKVCLTGTRDNTISEALIANGYDIANGVSKDTVMLIAKDKNSNSTKIKKAKQLGITIYSIDEIVELLNIKL